MTNSGTDTLSQTFDRQHESGVRRRLEEKLALLQSFNELLIESSGDCILVVDVEGMVLSINKTGRDLLEATCAEVLTGRHWAGLFSELDVKGSFTEAKIPKARSTFQASSRTKSGELKYWNVTFTAFDTGGAEADRFIVVARDVTEHMLAEKALRQSEEAFRKLFEENPIGIVLADLDLNVTKVNSALCAMLGYSDRELLGRRLSEQPFAAEGWSALEMEKLLRGELRSFQTETVFQTKQRQPLWGHLTTSLLRDAENVPFRFFQMVENIQDRKSSEEQVLAYQEQLQSLASELSLGEERERRRIATNLHDRIGQSLAFARLKLAGLSRDTGITEVQELIEQAIVDTRSLTVELSPPVLYELGLVAALEWLARKIQQEHGIQTRFHDDGMPKPLHENFRIVLFQAVRELLVNVVKHARATHAQVIVRRDSDALRIIIEDDGVGFDVSRISAKSEAVRSFGLFNIRERVEYLGGRVKIRSETGRGTRVTLIAPLKVEKQNEEKNERSNNHRR
jgi:PAS domain S-box-containing protein